MHFCFLMPQIEYYSPVSGGAWAGKTYEFTKELTARGHQVTVLTPFNGEPLYEMGNVVVIQAPRRNEIGAVRRAVYKIQGKVNRWDMPYYPPYLRSVLKAIRKLPTPPDVVLTYNDLASQEYLRIVLPLAKIYATLGNENRTRQANLDKTNASVEQYLAISQYVRDWTMQYLSVPPDKISTLLNGVNTETFHPRPNYLELRTPIRALFVGRIDPNKGPDIAADAVVALRKEGVAVEFTVAGGTWFYGHNQQDPYLQSLLKKIDMAGGKYLGPVRRKEIADLIRQHDIAFVLSRSNEPFGLVVLEAMASGLAVIASNRGGIPEACGGAGRLVDPDDFKAVVDNLRELATNPAALSEEKGKSVTRAAQCTWKKRTEELLQITASCNRGPSRWQMGNLK